MTQSNQHIYLDYNAATPIKPAVKHAIFEAIDLPSNASSVHRFGRDARMKIEKARQQLANAVNTREENVIFTSGAVEANNTVFMNFFDYPVFASTVEHASVARALPDDTASLLPVDRNGILDLDALENALKKTEKPALVSIIWVNNETGVIQPIEKIAAIAKKHEAILHTDAAQAFGKIPIDFKSLDIDLMTLSSHKIGGPQGVGALIVNPRIDIEPLLVGGGQEKNRRAGTENAAGIIGFGLAAELAAHGLEVYQKLGLRRDHIETALSETMPEIIIFGKDAARVANTTMFAIPGLTSEMLVINLDLEGFAVGSGSACSSGRVAPSRVLKAMGATEDEAMGAIRVSLGWNTSEDEVTNFIETFQRICSRVKS